MGMYDWEEFHCYDDDYEDAFKEETHYTGECRIIRETEKAWFLNVEGKIEKWFPKSQCDKISDTQFTIPLWLFKRG